MNKNMNPSPRIVVFAYSLVGYLCLKALIEAGETIVGVITHPDQPGETQWFPSVAKLARESHIPVIESEGPRDSGVFEALVEMKPDLIFSVYYRKMIPGVILDLPRLGAFNMHGSLLPRYRGRSPINWVLVHGETETGVTLHHMVKSADAGHMVDHLAVPIDIMDTAMDLTHRVGAAAVQVLLRQLPALKEGRALSVPQDESLATYFGGRGAQDSLIDWTRSALQIHNLRRAVPYPYFPSAFTYLNHEKIEIRANRVPSEARNLDRIALPGQIVEKGEGWIRVACGGGSDYIDITELSLPQTSFHLGDQFRSS